MQYKIFPASLECLHEMLHFICLKAQANGMDATQEQQIELALEEALVNIILHAYAKTSGIIEIHFENILNIGLKIVLVDNGIAFNPILNEIKSPLSNGGYGIILMKNMMDSLEYEYKDGYNRLSLTKFTSKLCRDF